MSEFLSALGSSIVPLAVLFVTLAIIVAGATASLYWKKVPANRAMVISGSKGTRIIKGGGTLVRPMAEGVAGYLNLEIMTIDVRVENVNTKEGVPVTADGVAQVKIGGTDEDLKIAAEQLLGKTPEEIKEMAQQTLAGHLRAILGKLTVEEAYSDRESFQRQVGETAANDMNKLGLEIRTFNLKDISDSQGYLAALGKKRTAEVIRDAQVGEANAMKEARIATATANQSATEAELETGRKIAEATMSVEVAKADYKKAQDTAKAQADMAYDLQEAEMKTTLATRTGSVNVETARQAALAAAERIKAEENLKQAEVFVPASAERRATVERATADADSIKLKAGANAEATRVMAAASAEQIRLTRTAEADGTRATGEAQGAATLASLEAQAKGEKDLADARAAQGQINVQLEIARAVIAAEVQKTQAIATAIAGLGNNVKIVQIGSANNGAKDNALVDLISQIPGLAATFNEQVKALSGDKNVATVVADTLKTVATAQAANGSGDEPDGAQS